MINSNIKRALTETEETFLVARDAALCGASLESFGDETIAALVKGMSYLIRTPEDLTVVPAAGRAELERRHAASVTVKGKVTTYSPVYSKATKRSPAMPEVGTNAVVVKGESVRLYGQRYKRDGAFDITFRVGDRAVYGSYNLTYTGTITAIGLSTVTITEDHGSRPTVHRMDLSRFAAYNWDFNAEEIARRNHETSQYI